VWTSDPENALGLPYQNVSYPDPLGPMPAWLVAGSRTTWVIEVHGYNGNRTTGLRVMPTLHALGYPMLDITYRNDVGAPPSPDHRLHLGDTEWQDLQAAVNYATAHGAKNVILYGWSMGGGIVENYLNRARGTQVVQAVILDAPVLDWNAIIAFQTDRLHLPGFFADSEELVLQERTGIDLDRINMLAANGRDGGPRQPVLLFHGTQDTVVPFATSATFAKEWPTKVTWMPVAGAGHTQSWNVEPQRYNQALTTFLNRVDPAG
jgi:pimeloyl-ACP methyl ester carboxylesterase